MYSYNLAYKDEPDDLMFPMEEDEVARRGGAFKSADCFCCSSSIPSAALVTGIFLTGGTSTYLPMNNPRVPNFHLPLPVLSPPKQNI